MNKEIFDRSVALPKQGEWHSVVYWHAFRQRQQAQHFVEGVRLDRQQKLTGGHTQDDIGELWWVGVEVHDPEKWGNRLAVNKHAASD